MLQIFMKETGHLLKDAEWDTPARQIVGYSANVKSLWGKGFALLGNAGEFLDPVFSSGVTIAFKSASLATQCLAREFAGEAVDWSARGYCYAAATGRVVAAEARAQRGVHRLIDRDRRDRSAAFRPSLPSWRRSVLPDCVLGWNAHSNASVARRGASRVRCGRKAGEAWRARSRRCTASASCTGT